MDLVSKHALLMELPNAGGVIPLMNSTMFATGVRHQSNTMIRLLVPARIAQLDRIAVPMNKASFQFAVAPLDTP